MTAHRTKAYIYLIIVAIIWGVASSVIKFTFQGISPLPFLSYRFGIAAIVSVIYFLLVRPKFPNPGKTIPLSIFYGFLAYTVALGLLFLGLEKTTVLDLTLITLLIPLLVVACGAIFFREHITKREKSGILIVLAGSLITAFYPMLAGKSNGEFSGNMILLAFMIADVGAIIVAKKLVQMKVNSLSLVSLGFIVGALTIIPLTIYMNGFEETVQTITTLPLKYHLGVWYMALISGTLAYSLSVLANKSIEISEAAIFKYLQPIFGVPLAIIWLGEKITPHFIVGAVIITIGIVIAEVKKKR